VRRLFAGARRPRLRPDQLTAADVDAVTNVWVSRHAVDDAVHAGVLSTSSTVSLTDFAFDLPDQTAHSLQRQGVAEMRLPAAATPLASLRRPNTTSTVTSARTIVSRCGSPHIRFGPPDAARCSIISWRMMAGLTVGDPAGEVAAAVLARQLLREVYAAADWAHARRRLTAFYQWCAEAGVPQLTRLATTISAWQDEVLAHHTTGLSNGPTEAVNLLIEKIRRIGHGFRNFNNYRLRLLLRCGSTWQAQPVARIRGRQPRLIA